MLPIKLKQSFLNNQGYTLVEILISGILFSLIVWTSVTVLQKSRELQLNDTHRRQARALLISEVDNYRATDANPLLRISDGVPPPPSFSRLVDIDTNQNGQKITATLVTTINPIPFPIWPVVAMPLLISSNISWSDIPGGPVDTMSLQKTISQEQ